MSLQKITITVEGASGVGKSAVSQAIAEFLEESGFDVELNFLFNEHPRRDEDRLNDALDAIRPRVKVTINEKISPRNGYPTNP